MKHCISMAGALALCAGAATAQTVINSENFESGSGGGWLANGQEMLFADPGDPANTYIGVPYQGFWGVTLRYETPGPVTGDLTRHGGPLTFAVDVQVFRLDNFFGDPLDPGAFPLVFELVDYPAPGSSEPPVSVYFIGPGLPPQFSGWERYTYDVPDPTGTELPAGWGGTGDEDPVTFEPRLPPSRTWRSVLENVDEVRVTTFVPGFFYSSNFWEMGFDDVEVTVDGAGCYADCDASGELDFFDFLCFQNLFAAGDPAADCDASAALDFFDFLCFQNEFAAGCP